MTNQNYSSFEVIEEYRQNEAINQSLLKSCYNYNNYVKALNYKEKPYKEQASHNKIGSAVDIALTMTQEDYNNTFYISMVNSYPSDNMMIVAKHVFEKASLMDDLLEKEYNIENYGNLIDETCLNIGYLQNYSRDKRIPRVINETLEFFNELKVSRGKIILTYNESLLVDTIVEKFRSSLLTREFVSGSDYINKNIKIYYQYPIYWTMYDIPCKALIDILIVNNNVAIPVDVKTMEEDNSLFPNTNFIRFGYNIQAAFYREGLRIYFNKISPNLFVDNFVFAVASKSSLEGTIKLFKVSNNTHLDSLMGRPESILYTTSVYDNSRGVRISFGEKIGIYQLINNYKQFSTVGDYQQKIQVI